MQNHYQTLGVSETATDAEIKSAYRKLAMEHHPDRNGGSAESEAKLKELNQAYDALKDPSKRAIYDEQRKWGGPKDYGSGFRKKYNWGTDDASMEDTLRDLYDTIIRESQRRTQYGSDSWDPFGKKYSPYGDILKNPNVRVAVEIPLRSILTEQKRVVNVNTLGFKFDVEVTIPIGVKTGTIVTYRGKGPTQHKSAPPGDLIVEFVVLPDKSFDRVGDDLVSLVTIDALDAIAGVNFEFTTIHDRKIKVSIPPGTQPGTTLRITGQGLPTGIGTFGHQFLKINVKVPTDLSDAQLALIREVISKRV